MIRSEKVEFVSLYCSKENIRNVIERLGNESVIEIIESDDILFNTNFESKKNNDLDDNCKKIEISIQKLKYLKEELKEENFDAVLLETNNLKNYNETIEKISEYYDKLVFLKNYKKVTKKEELQLEQNIKILKKTIKFVTEINAHQEKQIDFDFITAISDSNSKLMFKNMLKQRLRKNVYIKTYESKIDKSEYTIYIVYVLGTENKNLASNIIQSLNGRIFEYGKNKNEQYNILLQSLSDIKRVSKSIENQYNLLIEKIKNDWHSLAYSINKEKEIKSAISKFKSIGNADSLIGSAWVLQKNLKKLENLKSFENDKGRFLFEVSKSENIHPTHFETSQFSKSFQDLTNVFGIPKYREINPAIFMLFTFPFLFGAMFGDILHGLILFFISLFLIFKYDRLNGNCGVFQIILEGRFVVLACSLSAIWFGFLYGDFGSLPVHLFASQYEINRTYPFGIDPIWHHADNKMVFINSIKMKLSLIIGFAHMGLGAIISLLNAYHFKNKIDLICVSIPQFIAFFAFLGYLVFLCIFKWLVTVDRPSIVNTLISMYTDPFNIKDQMYTGQMYVQLCIFSFILITIPWMMLSKPLYMIMKKKVPEEGILDLWIGSGIHTVEFCLGLISNTSSYLRLWAVSLAHVQLTSVLHEFTIGKSNIFIKIFTFPIYLSGTFMLLIGLEGLSACLHALRLNWIEFFSKFYAGGGIEYKPFNFNLKTDEE